MNNIALSKYVVGYNKNLYKYYDNFANVSLDITLSHKKCIYQDMINRIDTYYEFPPLWSGSYRGLNGPLLKTIRQYPLMNKIEAKAYLKKFKFKNLKLNSELSKYTFFTYAKIKESLYQPIDCLSELYDQYKFPSEYRLISYQRTLSY